MRGEQVIVRAYRDEPLLRCIWDDEDEEIIFITTDEQLGLLKNGKEGLFIGFHKGDIFKYNPKLAVSMEHLYKSGKWDWNKLMLYRKEK